MSKKVRKPKEAFVDDGRVIADMDMVGMRHSIWDVSGVRTGTSEIASKKPPQKLSGEAPWTKKEMFYFYLGSVASVLLYGLIIFGGLALFLLLWLG